MQRNIEKRLKRISTPPHNPRRKEYGIYNRCLEKIFQKFQKIKKWTIFLVFFFGCLRISLYLCSVNY